MSHCSGIEVQSSNIAVQPVGFAAGVKAAEERLQNVYAKPHIRPVPVVAVENFLLEVGEDKWVQYNWKCKENRDSLMKYK